MRLEEQGPNWTEEEEDRDLSLPHEDIARRPPEREPSARN